MPEVFDKVDDTTVRVTKPIPATEAVFNFDLEFLIKQEASIIEQRDALIAAKESELSEVQKYIAEARKLGIKTRDEIDPKPVDVDPIDINPQPVVK